MKKTIISVTILVFLLTQLIYSQTLSDRNCKVPILEYHHISENPDEWNSIVISPEKFEEDMLYLKVLGYNTITFKDLISSVEEGTSLPENPVIITFDDGYKSNYTYAYPLLKKLDMKAVVSIIGSMIVEDGQDSNMMSWSELKEMSDENIFEIQAHSYDLHNWGDGVNTPRGVVKMKTETADEYKARFKEDTLALSKLMEENLGFKPTIYTYPFGLHCKESEEVIKELGFKGSLLGGHGLAYFPKNLFMLKRVNMLGEIETPRRFVTIRRLERKRYSIPFSKIKNQDTRIQKLYQKIK